MDLMWSGDKVLAWEHDKSSNGFLEVVGFSVDLPACFHFVLRLC